MKSITVILAMIMLTLVFLLLFSISTSPLWGMLNSQDSYTYMLIGKQWMEGNLPYVSLWDQKGPFIYLINGVGYLLTRSRTGVFILQSVFMTGATLFLYKLYRTQMGNKMTLLCTFLFFACLFSLYDGNSVEEYLLPFLLCCWYCQYTWINSYVDKNEADHNPLSAFVYGATLAFCLYTRLTNALGVCGGVAFITLFLLVKKRYVNLLQNVLAFIAGFLVLFLPMTLYFYWHDALDDMWYATFVYNLYYAGSSSHRFSHDFLANTFLRTYVDVYVCMAAAILLVLFNKRRRIVGWWLLSITFLIWLWLVNSFGFGHYGMICVPCSCLVLLETYQIFKDHTQGKWKYAWTALLVFYGVMVVSKDVTTGKHILTFDHYLETSQVDELMKHVPQEDYKCFVGYDIMPYCYVKYDIFPCYKYFTCQDFTSMASKEHCQKVMTAFDQCTAKWILVYRKNHQQKFIDDLLQKEYLCIDSSGKYRLYRKKFISSKPEDKMGFLQ